MEQNNWSTYVQNPAFLEASRIQILNPEAAAYELEKLHIGPGCRVLEVGCGTGIFCYYLGKVSEQVSYTGIDLDENLIAYAGKRPDQDVNGNTYRFFRADATELPFEEDSFDVVISHTFLTAAFGYEAAFQEMKRVCRPGGIIGTVNISDFEKTVHRRHDGSGRYEVLMRRFEQACEAIYPISASNAGLDPVRIPEYFASENLKEVSVYPIGSFFSLSNPNSILAAEEKKRFIGCMRDARLERLKVYSALRGFSQYLSQEECRELREAICKKAEEQLKTIGDNKDWDYDAMLYILVTGILGEKSEASAESKGLDTYRKTKYKDSAPKDTIRHIRDILDQLGIMTHVKYTQPGIEQLYSCRICIEGTDIGQNGKGTSAAYAMASGYAEFMERLATGYLFPFHAPDEMTLTCREAALRGGKMLRQSFSNIYQLPEFLVDNEVLLEKWAAAKKDDGCFSGYPFVSLEDQQEYFLPEFIYRGFAFTNGSCAGNSREEAIVQGICEIIERYASLMILSKGYTPPLIPDEQVKEIPELYQTICGIEQESGMRVFLLDASLGMGLPVAGAVLVDPVEKTACIHFGCHPKFEVALERSITELMQGRYLKHKTGMCHFGEEYEKTAVMPGNVFNVLKNGYGVLSQTLFNGITGEASWAYKGYQSDSLENSEMLDEVLGICRRLGWKVYLRDCSFFDFHVYHVFIPQASMILNFGKISIAQNQGKLNCLPVFKAFSQADREERGRAVKALHMFRGWQLHDTLDSVTGIRSNAKVFGVPVNADLLEILNALKEEDYETAAQDLKPYIRINESFWCLYQLCLKQIKGDTKGLNTALLRSADSLKQAKQLFKDPFKDLPCCKEGNCHNCPCAESCDTAFLKERLSCRKWG